jgi:hypothetical protein
MQELQERLRGTIDSFGEGSDPGSRVWVGIAGVAGKSLLEFLGDGDCKDIGYLGAGKAAPPYVKL